MAIFNVTGLDEAIKQLDLAADALKERAPEAAVAIVTENRRRPSRKRRNGNGRISLISFKKNH